MNLFSYIYSNVFFFFLALVLFTGQESSGASDLCYFDSGVKYCDYGCCSDSCCNMSTLAIVGLVIGAILGVVSIVGCIICLVCMCKQSSQNRDTVHPIHNNTNSVYVSNTPNHQPSRVAPPSYNQYGSYPSNSNTSYGFNDAAYPPGYHPPPAYSYSNPKPDKF